ncbi:hypothetical protein TRFO_18431 [Tritrichomonas foetus]|uniref:F5/8 type C domain-containing protein n=1 Tax=Tritrichomonas foetus TaxID=1144522 RepID=A0A1J4KL39_9EUKA|nr:hypothetical protein TRFO_18431 [Tritrichomonas foetus]|eukprot:OHT11947.1 hypothetical protein TRFO_18431 [Tritrichomonas foetus]
MMSFSLSLNGLKNVNFSLHEKDFTFIFDNENHTYQINSLLAEFLSPKISSLHKVDSSIDTFYLPNCNISSFSKIMDLLQGKSVFFQPKELSDFLNLGICLGNNEIIQYVNDQMDSENTPLNIVDKLLFEENYLSNVSKNLIRFAASNICEVPFDHIQKLSISTLSLIFRQECLSIYTEDWLFNLIFDLFQINQDYSELFQYVIFGNLKKESLQRFITVMPFEKVNIFIWSAISSLLTDAGIKDCSQSNRYRGQYFDCLDENMNKSYGILAYLTKKYNGNIHQLKVINLTSSGVNPNMPNRVEENILDSSSPKYFQSSDTENSWIGVDFIDRKVSLEKYFIQSRPDFDRGSDHLCHWILEGSDNNLLWSPLDMRDDNEILNGANKFAVFRISQNKGKFFRFLRLRITGPTASGYNNLTISSLEFYGYLRE